ncbi:MAG: hypothetical protein PHU85_18285, partial [Phycisphaerae bacterium]|nr:hypothetical protein [Phycisphaerae bacterium]
MTDLSTQRTQAALGKADFFLGNLAALWTADADLAMQLDQLADDQRLPREASRSGQPTARVSGHDGIARYLHSRYDPLREAAALVDANLRKDALCYVLFGGGLGYVAVDLLNRLPDEAAVVVVEPDLAT